VLKQFALSIIVLVMFNCKLLAQSNDSVLINQLVKEIAAMQYTAEGKYNFHKGMFYSYKKWAGYPQRYSPDNNIFYTGIIAFALQNMLPKLSDNNQKVAKDIIVKAASAYHHYQNKKGLPSYYFWQGGKPIMPNTYFVHKLSDQVATSEDVDDSVMLLMTMDAPDTTIQRLRLVMDSVANGKLRRIKNTYNKYKNLPAHTTYLGQKMRVDFDMSVHCNVLYFLLENKVRFNRYDSATLEIVTQMVQNREYLKDPKFVAPYYVNTPVILYHVARLMGKFDIPALQPYRQQIVADIRSAMQTTDNIMDDVILSTSLLRLGEKPARLPITSMQDFNNSNQQQFVFYQARAASQLGNPFKRLLLNFSMLNYHFFCPAYNKVLLLEYLVEQSHVKN
jgi:hypothetical protein